MEVYERKGLWRVKGKGKSFDSKEAAEAYAKGESAWKSWTPPELPVPEVREYDSMEEAIAEED